MAVSKVYGRYNMLHFETGQEREARFDGWDNYGGCEPQGEGERAEKWRRHTV